MCEDPGVFGGDGQQRVRSQRANTAVMLMEDNQGGVCWTRARFGRGSADASSEASPVHSSSRVSSRFKQAQGRFKAVLLSKVRSMDL